MNIDKVNEWIEKEVYFFFRRQNEVILWTAW